MSEWWTALSPINRAFFSAAAFCSVLFLWQMIAALMGLGDHDGVDTDGGTMDSDLSGDAANQQFESDAVHDGTSTEVAFKLLSIRAIITFATLFTWGSALYLNQGESLSKAMGISAIWGFGGMLCIAFILALLPKLTDTGTKQISSALGKQGTVYLDIPKDGQGEVRVLVSGRLSFVKARSADGAALKSGTPIVVKQILDESTVVVETVNNHQ